MNKEWIKVIVLALIVLISSGVLYYFIVKNSPPSTDELILKEIQKIESKIDSLSDKKDSIKTKIIKTDKEIVNNEKHYEEVVNTIITQPSNADSIFSRDYIQRFIDERIR